MGSAQVIHHRPPYPSDVRTGAGVTSGSGARVTEAHIVPESDRLRVVPHRLGRQTRNRSCRPSPSARGSALRLISFAPPPVRTIWRWPRPVPARRRLRSPAPAAALADENRPLIVVAPTSHLKIQWSRAAHRMGLQLDPDWSPGDGLARDVHGLVTTYQQLAMGNAAKKLAGLSAEGFIILDEIHHAGHEKAWGDGVRKSFGHAHKRLSLSGTPFRSDAAQIPFVRYDNTAEGELAHADYTYGYADRAARRRRGAPGLLSARRRGDGVDIGVGRHGVGQLPRRADQGPILDAPPHGTQPRRRVDAGGPEEGQRPAPQHPLRAARRRWPGHPRPTRTTHSRSRSCCAIVSVCRLTSSSVTIPVHQRRSPSSARTTGRGSSRSGWCPRGSTFLDCEWGCSPPPTSTELFFRQAVGRFVRWQAGRSSQKAYVYIPDDPRLRAHAFTIAEARRHVLRPPGTGDDDDFQPDGGLENQVHEDDMEQMSLFSVVASTATDITMHTVGEDGKHLDGIDFEMNSSRPRTLGWLPTTTSPTRPNRSSPTIRHSVSSCRRFRRQPG